MQNSTLHLHNVTAGLHGGGAYCFGDIEVSGRSTWNISNSHALSGNGGGLVIERSLKVSNRATLISRNARAAKTGGGSYAMNSSTLTIQNVTSQKYGGGFYAKRNVVMNSSTVSIQHARTNIVGGGFATAGDVVIAGSDMSIVNAEAEQGGGFEVEGRLYVVRGSTLNLHNATARLHGGGMHCFGEIEVSESSTLNISNSHSLSGNGGGFNTEQGLKVSSGSDLIIRKAMAGKFGGGFFAKGEVTLSSSKVRVQNVAANHGGGFYGEGNLVLADLSTITMFDTRAKVDGGGFVVGGGLTLLSGSISISNSTAVGSGAGGRVDGQVLLSPQTSLDINHTEGNESSSVLEARCLHLRPNSKFVLEGVFGGHALDLRNSDCSRHCANVTFQVAPGAAINASGSLSSGFLSLASCPSEQVRLSGIDLQSWDSSLLTTRPTSVVVDGVSIHYKPSVNNLQILAAQDG